MTIPVFKPQRLMLCIAAVAGSALLTACASLPGHTDVAGTKSIESYATAQSFAQLSTGKNTAQENSLAENHSVEKHLVEKRLIESWPTPEWWIDYDDVQLNQLMKEAFAESPSLQIAQARLARARAYQDVTGSARLPQISASTNITEQKLSYNHLTPSAMTPHGWNDYGRTSLDFSWELDFFGRNRAALAAATSDAEAARADVAQAQLSLSASIALAYAEFARLFAARDTADSALRVRVTTASLFEQRYRNGLETLGSLRQAEARRASAQVDLASIDEQLALQRHRIAALLGAGPDRGLSLVRPQINVSKNFSLPAALSVNLLGRRPDLAVARLRAEAAAQRIDQAQIAFYPNVNLTAYTGFQSLGLDMLTKDGSSIGSVGPAISLPIFNGEKLRGQLRGARAEYQEAVANYERTLVQALQDVADATVSYNALHNELAASDEAVTAAREAWQTQQNRYRGGISAYLEVLSAEDYFLSTERVQSELHTRAFALDISLKKALGGGYQHPDFSF